MIQHENRERQREHSLTGYRWTRRLRRGGKKCMLALMAGLIGGFFLTSEVLKAADEQEVPEEIVIQNDVYKSDKKGPVKFSHLDHAENYDVTCAECHHVYKDGKNVWEEGQPVQKCAECHDPDKSEGNVKKLQIAFHRNCKDCHSDRVKEGISEDAPYKKCNDCHEKK